MKVISLNLWGGRVHGPLIEFLKTHQDIDIFCFQEVYHNGHESSSEFKNEAAMELFKDISNVLTNHVGFFRSQWEEHWGLAMFVKKGLQILEEGELFVHKYKGWTTPENSNFLPKNIQYIKTATIGDKNLTVINFHGLWNGQGKTDTEERISQSQNILNFIKTLDHEYVLLGDFNLRPDTQSLKMFEDFGLHNLISKHGITSTRTSLYKKSERYADYAFVTKGINVVDFKVLPDEVSDHTALYLEIKL